LLNVSTLNSSSSSHSKPIFRLGAISGSSSTMNILFL
jgi:hypothetical protein